MDDARRQRRLERRLVHVGDHENVAARGVDRNASGESVGAELRLENGPLFPVGNVAPPWIGHGQWAPRKKLKKRVCSFGSSRKTPVNCVVTVETPSLRTPRIAMQVCSASIISATPRVASESSIAITIWAESASCVCRRRAKVSTIRASFDRPTTPSLG